VIVSFSHPGRCRSDAAFAALAGTSALQASSGQTVRHRLNRGDRALNSALHIIATIRMRSCPMFACCQVAWLMLTSCRRIAARVRGGLGEGDGRGSAAMDGRWSTTPGRLYGVHTLGVEETAFLAAIPTSGTVFATGIVAINGRPRPLNVVQGRSGKALRDWVSARDPGWRERIAVAALDPYRG
jgi:hypothetical protein